MAYPSVEWRDALIEDLKRFASIEEWKAHFPNFSELDLIFAEGYYEGLNPNRAEQRKQQKRISKILETLQGISFDNRDFFDIISIDKSGIIVYNNYKYSIDTESRLFKQVSFRRYLNAFDSYLFSKDYGQKIHTLCYFYNKDDFYKDLDSVESQYQTLLNAMTRSYSTRNSL